MHVREIAIGLVLGLGLGAGISTVSAQDDVNERPETVVREGLAPTRQAPEGNVQATLYAEGENAFLGKLRVRGGETIPEHRDESEEYLYVLKGEGTLTVDGTEYDLKPHTGVYLPSGSKVKFENGDRTFEAVQMLAPPNSANAYSDWETGQQPMEPGSGESEKQKRRERRRNRSQ